MLHLENTSDKWQIEHCPRMCLSLLLLQFSLANRSSAVKTNAMLWKTYPLHNSTDALSRSFFEAVPVASFNARNLDIWPALVGGTLVAGSISQEAWGLTTTSAQYLYISPVDSIQLTCGHRHWVWATPQAHASSLRNTNIQKTGNFRWFIATHSNMMKLFNAPLGDD